MQPSAAAEARAGGPPAFVRLSSHPVRWRLLQELVQSDRPVRELTTLVSEPQSLVSYHLRQLRDGGLVSSRRSSADRRDAYYAIDLAQCEAQLQAAGGALHPGLRLATAAPSTPRHPRSGGRLRVLFLCTGNSARSQIAEALLVDLSSGTIEAASAGSNPKSLHPNAVRVMRKRGVDIRAHRVKHLDEFADQPFDLVVTLCDRVREVCPEFPSPTRRAHWSLPDPSAEGGGGADHRASYPAFQHTAVELETRIRFLIAQLAEPATPRRSTHGDG